MISEERACDLIKGQTADFKTSKDFTTKVSAVSPLEYIASGESFDNIYKSYLFDEINRIDRFLVLAKTRL